MSQHDGDEEPRTLSSQEVSILRAIRLKQHSGQRLRTRELAFLEEVMGERPPKLGPVLTEEQMRAAGVPEDIIAIQTMKAPRLPRLPSVPSSGRRARSKGRRASLTGGEVKAPPTPGQPPRHVGPPLPGVVPPGQGRKKG